MATTEKQAMKAETKKPAAKKATATKKADPKLAHIEKLKAGKGKRVKYSARTHTGTGVITEFYAGKRGDWVKLTTKDNGDVTVRPSQVTFY